MDHIPNERFLNISGTPYHVGRTLGQHLKDQLARDIDHYISAGPVKFGELDPASLNRGAMDWFETLPERFRREMEGVAEGSGVPLQKIALWGFADVGGRMGCSSFILRSQGETWIGRNNDLWVPDLWGYAIQRQITGRLGTLTFGMRGEIFAATGLNEAGLWLHYNWLPAFDLPAGDAHTPFVVLTDILETCTNIDQVESRLKTTKRNGGMLIFASEGQSDACTMLECACQAVSRKDCDNGFLAGTNHYQSLPTPQPPSVYAPASVARLEKMTHLLAKLRPSPGPKGLIRILADPGVEQHQEDYGTVYANLCSTTARQLWFTFGGYPAASRGNWQKMPWPF